MVVPPTLHPPEPRFTVPLAAFKVFPVPTFRLTLVPVWLKTASMVENAELSFVPQVS
ncbi:hypothetical protein CV133_gene46 [Chlorobiaceae phage CV-1-33]|nr:hypothetical protein CV133_gene46 [Chlorobiaceae phage CV-1-33]